MPKPKKFPDDTPYNVRLWALAKRLFPSEDGILPPTADMSREEVKALLVWIGRCLAIEQPEFKWRSGHESRGWDGARKGKEPAWRRSRRYRERKKRLKFLRHLIDLGSDARVTKKE